MDVFIIHLKMLPANRRDGRLCPDQTLPEIHMPFSAAFLVVPSSTRDACPPPPPHHHHPPIAHQHTNTFGTGAADPWPTHSITAHHHPPHHPPPTTTTTTTTSTTNCQSSSSPVPRIPPPLSLPSLPSPHPLVVRSPPTNAVFIHGLHHSTSFPRSGSRGHQGALQHPARPESVRGTVALPTATHEPPGHGPSLPLLLPPISVGPVALPLPVNPGGTVPLYLFSTP